jgi:glycosyltransferase involved in cell wall biosynthesis
MSRRHVFVVPELTAMISGGNLYNLGLSSALRAAGAAVLVVDRDGAAAAIADDDHVWIDSLFLDALPALAGRGARVGLLAHYLPSLVARGAVPEAAALGDGERAAIAAAAAFLAPSAYMGRALVALGAAARRVLVVAPGLEIAPAPADATGDVVAATIVANLVPGKGVLPFLDALARQLDDGAPLRLTIIGSDAFDGAYARACRACVAATPALVATVRFAGARAHAETLAAIAQSDLLLSPSRMESFGLALAEARAAGTPILARDGGNAAAHVDERAGGQLFFDDETLAAACARLLRDRAELARRRAAAAAGRPPLRRWRDAAAELLAWAGDEG